MANAANTRTFKAKTIAEAMSMAKSAMGPNVLVVSRRHVSQPGLFSKLKLGGETLSVELEVAMPDPEPETPPQKKTNPHLIKSYEKAREYRENFDVDAKLAMAAAAAPHASLGETSAGVAKLLDDVRRELADSRRESAEHWDRVRMLVSLQARGGVPAVSPAFLDSYRTLIAAEVREELARDIVEKLQRDFPGENDAELVAEMLLKELARRIPVAGPLLVGGRKPLVVALVGASGVGKTTSVVKLVIQFAMRQGKSVAVINEDLRRPGADTQINNAGKMCGVPVLSVSEPKGIADVVRSLSGKDLILLDTCGRSPRDKKDIARLAEVVEAAGAHETHLLLSAVASEKDMRRTVEVYAPTGFDRVILTKLDECASPGVVVNVGSDLAAGLSYITTGPDYARPIEAADQDFLAELVLGRRAIAPDSDDGLIDGRNDGSAEGAGA